MLQNRVEVSCRGFDKFAATITDFGADVPFAQIRDKIREHYGIRIQMANWDEATIAEGHARKISDMYMTSKFHPTKEVQS